MRSPLTDHQRKLFEFICAFEERHKRLPTNAEMARGKIGDEQVIEPKTTRTAHWPTIERLKSKGYLKPQVGQDARPFLTIVREEGAL